jgi:hypothetical protein
VLPPHGQELAVFGELLYAAVKTVHHVEVVLAVKGQARRATQFTLAAAGFAPLVQEFSLLIKDGNPLQVVISDIQVFVPIQINGGGPDKLPISGPEAAKLPEELMIRGAFANALAELFCTTVDHIHNAVGTQGKIYRSPEPQAGHAVHPKAITEIKHPPGRSSRQHCFLLAISKGARATCAATAYG